MKGIVFNQLQDFVEGQCGLRAWDQAIMTCCLASNGVYVATKNYDDVELDRLVTYFSAELAIAKPDLIRAFGQFVFPQLLTMAPAKAKQAKNLRAFLLMVHGIIHAEVNKLYQDANLPHFDYQDKAEVLVMLYRSERKLCYFSEGLILAAAEHFDEQVRVRQSQCMHTGAKCCQLEVEFL